MYLFSIDPHNNPGERQIRKCHGTEMVTQWAAGVHPRTFSCGGTELGLGPNPSGSNSRVLAFPPLCQSRHQGSSEGFLCNFLSLPHKLHILSKDHERETCRRADWRESVRWGDTSPASRPTWVSRTCRCCPSVQGDPAAERCQVTAMPSSYK